MAYFLNQFANLMWKIDLCQIWLISLLFLSLSSTLFAIPHGIQYNSMAIDDIENGGCSICYSAPYHEVTTSNDIGSCTGPVLFVGAKEWEWWDSYMFLGAFGLASEVLKRTELNTPHEYNGVYWYFTYGKSFGFLKDNDLHQNTTADTGTTNADSRLSWNVDNGLDGYRVGAEIVVSYQIPWWKYIYNCPNNFSCFGC